MSVLLILIIIKFFLNRGVVDVLFQWLYLEKYYLLLVWATQSMFHIVANTSSPMRDGRLLSGWGTSLPSEVRRDASGEAWPPERKDCRGGGRLPLPLLRPLPATISFNHCRRHGTLAVVRTEGGDAGRWA